MRPIWKTVRVRLAARRHTVLLVAIVTAFAVRPLFGDVGLAPVLFSIALLMLVFIALYNIRIDELVGKQEHLLRERRRWLVVGCILALLALVERILLFLAPSRAIFISGPICWSIPIWFIIWQELRAVLRQRHVTGETISIAISVYLLLGIAWGMLYVLLYHIQSGAFSFSGSLSFATPSSSNQPLVFQVLIYFSLTTLSTIGFGDIAPVTLQARYLAVAEGITGQFYLAILVARLVAMQMSASTSHPAAGNRYEPTPDPDSSNQS